MQLDAPAEENFPLLHDLQTSLLAYEPALHAVQVVDTEIFPVIIDHNLRQESSREAYEVENLAKKLGFKTSIKKICGKKPTGNIQNWARKKRRDLLCEATYKLSANLILAHHFDDQAETLFMRFTKKSGLDCIP